MGWNDMVIEQFRAGNTRVADQFDRDSLLLLHTTGAKSGQPRIAPVAHFRDGDRVVIVASAAGSDHHPDWYHNLLANPTVQSEVWENGELKTTTATARTVGDGERDKLWSEIVAQAPGFGEYQTKTTRQIPIVVLEPAGA
ncbi:MAG TPA: nitroreductase family deazaflavin-dependent oxidoreductase [Pseudonocardia sp.]